MLIWRLNEKYILPRIGESRVSQDAATYGWQCGLTISWESAVQKSMMTAKRRERKLHLFSNCKNGTQRYSTLRRKGKIVQGFRRYGFRYGFCARWLVGHNLMVLQFVWALEGAVKYSLPKNSLAHVNSRPHLSLISQLRKAHRLPSLLIKTTKTHISQFCRPKTMQFGHFASFFAILLGVFLFSQPRYHQALQSSPSYTRGISHLFQRQSCADSNCTVGYDCCTEYPGYCCPAGVACFFSNSTVLCNTTCTATSTSCGVSCCLPGAYCDESNQLCYFSNSTSTTSPGVSVTTSAKVTT